MSQYVILTGSKNNAGDFLIKYRAKQLFAKERPDRKIIDINGWETLDCEKLEQVNQSEALILMGGPALQKDMWPGVYGLTNNLDDISVPIIMMGIGWYSKQGDWINSYNYPLGEKTLQLLDRIKNSGYLSSVRDYHTLNSLWFHNVDNVLMTGCPAYYDYEYIGKGIVKPKLKRIGFSLGVSFINSPSMEKLMKDNILRCRDFFSDEEFTVAFHHSLDPNIYLKTHNSNNDHLKRHQQFVEWLKVNDISYVDISGSAENLMNFYSQMDLHIGYRVHAHIFMNSIARFSILLSEDGRAKATRNVIGGIVLDGVLDFKEQLIYKVAGKLKLIDRYTANTHLTEELIYNIKYEKSSNFSRLQNSRKQIDSNFSMMQKFLRQLP
ncbi:polysaccharide pyruvyl transferase family protein [Acinetobacter baumannii]|uniref:polysaccharide pyruvyl transferase family protein n=1 Tax=Acinetobacter baumannii TaxID=470 RepID=UPI000BF96563|nr:polysaccharide pyruvyl transferase family protein [Acinetobacter baumannii]MDC4991036.1 polysaccharide pyruvyl transferase family protein [Acinetobacter baumannii]MDC4994398.1 polysaccharide pyruvyl transferase family protein [Acinetobacter baumannii]MDC5561159.1 polysaccharide pyruvyl transferase family protein [Acinetobacter baumannii]WCS38190.1 polysaccharide pyruvyl transferase family protein [Acinetobacter baumannii]